jgi:hypothetical protein
MEIEIKTVKLKEIKLNPDNPRRISTVDMDRLVKSLQDFPDMMQIREIVVDETMTCLGGNMRTLALRKAGAAACLTFRFREVRSGITCCGPGLCPGRQIKRFRRTAIFCGSSGMTHGTRSAFKNTVCFDLRTKKTPKVMPSYGLTARRTSARKRR